MSHILLQKIQYRITKYQTKNASEMDWIVGP